MYLTPRQKEILDYISSYIATHKLAPTLKEICQEFKLSSVATAYKHVNNLMLKGAIKREANKSRAIELIPSDDMQTGIVELPLLGKIAAGCPIEAIEESERVDVPLEMVKDEAKTYVLQVKGRSMIDEQIRDGDFVIIEQRSTAENGQTVVALINGTEVTLKKFYKEKDHVRLQPANQQMEPIIIKNEDIRLQGVVVGLMRRY